MEELQSLNCDYSKDFRENSVGFLGPWRNQKNTESNWIEKILLEAICHSHFGLEYTVSL